VRSPASGSLAGAALRPDVMPDTTPNSELAVVKGRAVLFSEMTPRGGDEDTFNDFEDSHHTPGHLHRVPGVISAMRYRSRVGPHYLTVYELESPATLKSEAYRNGMFTPDEPGHRMPQSVSGFTCYLGEETFWRVRDDSPLMPLDAPVIWCVFLSVPLEGIDSFARWFDGEYAPRLLEDPGWLMVRRFDTVEYDPEPYSQMMLHYLTDEAVRECPARAGAETSDAFRDLAAQRWYQPHGVVYHRRRQRFLKNT